MTQDRIRSDSAIPVTLVTGASGLIGYAVAEALMESGMRVLGLSRRAPDADTPWESRIQDLLAPDAADALSDLPLEAVVHCAAAIPKQFGAADERLVADVNLKIDSAVFELAVRRSCRVVFASSSSVYGSVPGLWSEDVVPQPKGPYAQAKVASEVKMRAQGVQGAILRINAPYGARQRGMTVLRMFIESAVAGRDLVYHGTGGREQDFVATEDVAAASLLSLKRSGPVAIYNIAGGEPISMRELAHLVVKNVPDCVSRVLPSGRPDPQEGYRPRLGLEKARLELGWQPTIPLEQGIQGWVRRVLRGRSQ